MGRSSIITAFATFIITLLGCSRGEVDRPVHAFSVYDRDGVSIAETKGGPKYRSELFSYELMLTLHGDESKPESLLHLPESDFPSTSFTVDESGYFYLTDTQNHRIAVFRPDGSYELSFGQEGQGPGDLRYPSQIVEQDGILRVQDNNRRTSLYSTDGTLIDMIQFKSGGNSIWGNGEYAVDIRSPSNPPDYTTLRSEAIVRDARGDTIAVISTPEITIAIPIPAVARIDNSRRMRPIAIQYSSWPQILHLKTSEFLLYAGAGPELSLYDISGKLTRIVRLDMQPELISSNDQKAVKDRLRELMQLALTNPSIFPLELNPSDIPFADEKAPWQAVEVDDAGYIWLQVSLPSFPFSPIGKEPVDYRLLSPEGEYLGNTHRPAAATGQVVRGYFLAFVNDEEIGTIIPTVYKISSLIKEFTYPN